MRGSDPNVPTTKVFSWRFMTPLLVGSALNPINTSLIATALVSISAAARAARAYSDPRFRALPGDGGRSADRRAALGRVRAAAGVLAGLLAVVAGGALGALGSGLTTLVVARALIGAGTSTAYPSAMLLMRRRAEEARMDEPPASVLGALVMAGTVSAAAGLPLGSIGMLVDAWGWRTTFWVNIPLAIGALALSHMWIRRDPTAGGAATLRHLAARIDLPGIAGFGVAMTALLIFLLALPRLDWVALGLAVLSGAALVSWKMKAGRPFLDVRLLAANLTLTRTYVRFALTMLCVYTVFYGVTQALARVRAVRRNEPGHPPDVLHPDR